MAQTQETQEYPYAIQRPLPADHYSWAHVRKTLIVLHITEGSTAAGAIAWFFASKAPHRISVHFVIDRDGTVTQLVPLTAVAWHASQVNNISVGIEHVAISGGKLPITPDQIISSARLVRWVAKNCNIPIDRDHVKSHFEASPKDGHALCCFPTLDPDDVVKKALINS